MHRNLDPEKVERIARDFDLSAVVLFGSRSGRKPGFKNDYDFAVLAKSNKMEMDNELALICRFSQFLRTDDFDLILLNFASPLLQYEVARKGRLIYEDKAGLFNRFRWYAIQRWNENRKFHDLGEKYINDYLKEKIND